MDRDRPRWRIRISTLMLLVIIAALSAALVAERRRSLSLERQALAKERLDLAQVRSPFYNRYSHIGPVRKVRR
jgi:hypothetical protein